MNKIVTILSLVALLYSCEAKVKITPSFNITEEKEKSENLEDTTKMKNLSFPKDNNFTNEYLKQNFWRLDYEEAGEKLSYFIIVPKSVRPVEIEPTPLTGTGLTLIGKYKPKDKDLPYFEVCIYYESVKNRLHPADWVKEKLQLVGHKVINQNEIISPLGNKYIDVLSKKSNVIARSTELSNGEGDYVMFSVFCEEKDYENLAETMQFISSNWKIK